MAEHVLKCWPVYFDAVERGDKTFEVRRDDRGFQKGDVLILRKTRSEAPYHPEVKRDAGVDGKGVWQHAQFYELRRKVLYVLTGGQFGIEPGYIVMALGPEDA